MIYDFYMCIKCGKHNIPPYKANEDYCDSCKKEEKSNVESD